MGVLTEFVRKEAEHLRDEARQRDELRRDWLESIDKLFATLSSWIVEADAGSNLLTVERSEGTVRQEPLLGAYPTPVLRINLGGRLSGRGAEVVARARRVAATILAPDEPGERRADGMVEIRDSGTATHYLFRLAGKEGVGDRWFIRDGASWNRDLEDNKVEELTQERFEAAILRALK